MEPRAPGQRQVAKPPGQERPATAPGRQFNVRKHQQMLQQLRNTIKETEQAPPAGFDRAKIAKRRDMLQRILKDVENQGDKAKQAVAVAYAERYKKANDDQRAKEERILHESIKKSAASNEQHDEYMEHYKRFWHTKNKGKDEHAVHSAKHLVQTTADRQQRAYNEGERRQKQLEKLNRKRFDEKVARQKRQSELEAHNAEMVQRKAKQEEEHRAYMQELAEVSRLKAKKYADTRERLKREQEAERAKHREQTRSRGVVGKVVVQLRPTVEVKTIEVPHEKRLQLQVEKERRKYEDYHAEDGDGGNLRKMAVLQKARREARHQTQQANREEIANKKLRRYTEIKEQLAKDDKYVAEFKRLKGKYLEQKGEEKREVVMDHIEKAQQRWEEKIDGGHRANYDRWNRRADCIMEGLIGQYAEFLDDVEQYHMDAADGGGASDDNPPTYSPGNTMSDVNDFHGDKTMGEFGTMSSATATFSAESPSSLRRQQSATAAKTSSALVKR